MRTNITDSQASICFPKTHVPLQQLILSSPTPSWDPSLHTKAPIQNLAVTDPLQLLPSLDCPPTCTVACTPQNQVSSPT